MAKVSKELKPEQVQFIKRLPWERTDNPIIWVSKRVPGITRDKVRAIFQEWGMGWYADRHLCKGDETNIFVLEDQWSRFDLNPADGGTSPC